MGPTEVSFKAQAVSALSGLLVVSILLTIVAEFEVVPQLLLPHPRIILAALLSLFQDDYFWISLWATSSNWITSIVLGTLFGLFIGVAASANPYAWAAILPIVEMLRSLPSVVIVPIFALFLGAGDVSKVACASTVVAVLIIAVSGTAIRSLDRSYLRLAAAWCLSTRQLYVKIVFPALLPELIIAIKAALPLALIVCIASEMLVSTQRGLGVIVLNSLAVFKTDTMYATVFCIAFMGYSASLIGSVIEKKLLHWSGK